MSQPSCKRHRSNCHIYVWYNKLMDWCSVSDSCRGSVTFLPSAVSWSSKNDNSGHWCWLSIFFSLDATFNSLPSLFLPSLCSILLPFLCPFYATKQLLRVRIHLEFSGHTKDCHFCPVTTSSLSAQLSPPVATLQRLLKTDAIWISAATFFSRVINRWNSLPQSLHSELLQKRTGQYEEYEDEVFYGLAGPPDPTGHTANWTTREYANSRIANSRTGHLADWSTRGLDNSRTSQLADWTTRSLADATKSKN